MEKISSSFRLESHPGRLLVEHLKTTAQNMSLSIKNKKMSFQQEVDIKILSNVGWIIGFTHDFGKATTYFQDYLNEKDENKKKELKNKKETNHSFISSLFTYQMVSSYLKNNKLLDNNIYQYLPLLSYVIVKRHHGNLINIDDEINFLQQIIDDHSLIQKQFESIYWQELKSIIDICHYVKIDKYDFQDIGLFLNTIFKIERKKWRKYCRNPSIDLFMLFQIVFSLLLSSDKKDAIGIEDSYDHPEIREDLVDVYRQKKFGKVNSNFLINPIRNEIYDIVCKSINNLDLNDKIYSIDVPTGTGKTLTGFSFALKLRQKLINNNGFIPKIIYCLPFLSIIEQNFDVFEEIFKVVFDKKPNNSLLIKHHHLAEIKYKNNKNEELPTDESQFLIEGWESEIIVTTFMQLFHTLISNKNRMLRKFNAMINSIIILDEIQTVPYKYWYLMRKFFYHFAENFNTRFIFMTATQPLIFQKQEIVQLVSHKDKLRYINQLNRINFINKSSEKQRIEQFNEILCKEIIKYPDDDFLIVLNTINSSIKVYDEIEKFIKRQNILDIKIYYLSTNIIPLHRIQRINDIKDKEKKMRKIIVSTQLVEAGVDIDVDRIYRDFAPFDSLNQVAGRCNRNFSKNKKKGTVTLYTLKDKQEFYKYIYGKSDMAVINTKRVLEEKTILSEKDFLNLGTNYFETLQDYNDKSEDILKSICKLKFKDACDDFNLIDSNYPTTDLFIEINDDAEKVWEQYKNIREEKDVFKRKSLFNGIKKDFYNYIISVPEKKFSNESEYHISFINKEQLGTVYNRNTGFIRTDQYEYII